MSSLSTLTAVLALLGNVHLVFTACPGSPSAVTIGTDVTSIAEKAYYECSTITSLVISSTVTSFGKHTIINIIFLIIDNNNILFMLI